MADNKADMALKEAKLDDMANRVDTLKVYFSGRTPGDCGHTVVNVPQLSEEKRPWLIKWYTDEPICHQFLDANTVYKTLSRELSTVLDAVIVNNKQRESVSVLIDKILYDNLMRDNANENNIVI